MKLRKSKYRIFFDYSLYIIKNHSMNGENQMKVVAIVDVIGVGVILVRDLDTYQMAENLLKTARLELGENSAKVSKLESEIEKLKDVKQIDHHSEFGKALKIPGITIKNDDAPAKPKPKNSNTIVRIRAKEYEKLIMNALWKIPDMNIDDIAAEVNYEASKIYPHVNELCKNGYIEGEFIKKIPGTSGRGTKHYCVTQRGRTKWKLIS